MQGRTTRIFVGVLLLAAAGGLRPARASDDDDLAARRSAQDVNLPPEGRTLETIHHDDPKRYVKIPASAGDAAHIRKLAKDLADPDPERVFVNIDAFIEDEVPDVPEQGWDPDPKDFDRLVKGFDHRGCASHALVFASLARACGIPVVYIKSSRHSWIRKYVVTGEGGDFSGHVFLEVHVKGKWRLLDAQGLRIWDDYDPADPELPGGLLAYEKGSDHLAMVHSTQRDRFIAEDRARWKGFDVSKLRENDAPGRSLHPEVYAVTVGGEWKALGERVPVVLSFDRGYWAQYHRKVLGRILIVTAIGGKTDVPEDVADEWLPVGRDVLAEEAAAGECGVRTLLREDKTRVVLLSAPGRNTMMRLIWTVKLRTLVAGLAR